MYKIPRHQTRTNSDKGLSAPCPAEDENSRTKWIPSVALLARGIAAVAEAMG
jgi:hypothetical protein